MKTTAEIVTGLAGRQDYFGAGDLAPWLSRRVAEGLLKRMSESGEIIKVKRSEGPIEAVFSDPKRLVRKCELAKLESECAVSRKTLASNSQLVHTLSTCRVVVRFQFNQEGRNGLTDDCHRSTIAP